MKIRNSYFKRILTVAVFSIILSDAFVKASEKEIGVFVNGEKSGQWIGYFEKGEKKYSGTFSEGRKIGLWTEYYRNGNKKEETNYFNDEICGRYTSYYKTGQVNESYYVFDGKSQGFVTSYHENGQIKEIGMVRDGIKVGKWKSYYENGQIGMEFEFSIDPPGQLIGISRRWYEDGKKQSICSYTEESHHKYGIPDGEFKEWYPNEKMKIDADFKNGFLINDLECWYESGDFAIKAHFSEKTPGVPDGQWTFHYKNGKEALNCSFDEGEIDPQCQFFSEEGNPQDITGKEELSQFVEKFNKNIFGETRFSVLHPKCIKFEN
jgi:uncharacterized protein